MKKIYKRIKNKIKERWEWTVLRVQYHSVVIVSSLSATHACISSEYFNSFFYDSWLCTWAIVGIIYLNETWGISFCKRKSFTWYKCKHGAIHDGNKKCVFHPRPIERLKNQLTRRKNGMKANEFDDWGVTRHSSFSSWTLFCQIGLLCIHSLNKIEQKFN